MNLIKLKRYLWWIFSLWLFFLLVNVGCKSTRRPPTELPNLSNARFIECYMLLPWQGMTLEIIKDVTLKISQANSIQEKYKYTLTYELGTLAAGIQETFEHMLEIYRTYSNLHDFKNMTHNLTVTMNAYHVIQGDYNKIRLEKELFRQVKDKFEARRIEKIKKMKKLGVDTDRLPKGTPNPKDIHPDDAKAMAEFDAMLESRRSYQREPNGLPWKITTTTTKRRLWGPAPVDYISIT